MGRVARYKKVKAFDPYSSKNGGRLDADTVGVWGLGESGRRARKRSRTSQKLRTLRKKNPLGASADFDVAPEQHDDFDLADLVGSLKREKNPLDEEDMKQKPYVPPKLASDRTATAAPSKTKTTAAAADPKEKEQAKLLKKVQQQVSNKLTEPNFEDRRPGESRRAYNRRVKLETRQIIRKERQMEHNPLKRQKKKEFLNSKKKKRSRRAAFDHSDDDSCAIDERTEQAEGKLLTGEQAVAARARATQVHFGEQAERPPVFHQLPRGAKNHSKGQSYNKGTGKTYGSGSGGMKEEEIEAERQAMDLMRRKVQAQYAAIKAKRKQAGEFHL